MTVGTRRFTASDLAATPDDRYRYEVIGGELIVSPAPPIIHQQCLGSLLISFMR